MKDLMKHHCQIKKSCYSQLYLEEIIDEDDTHVQKVFKEFGLRNLADYHDLYVQSDTLLLADIFENFSNKCIKIYELEHPHFLSALRLAWQACLKKTEVELELLTNTDMLLMIEKGIRDGICHAIHRYTKANNKYMKNYDKNIISSYLMYLDAKGLHGWGMSQKLLVKGFKWIEELSKFNESFIKDYDENSNKGYFFEVDVEYPKNLFNLHSDLPFLPERNEIKKCNKLVCNIKNKKTVLFT